MPHTETLATPQIKVFDRLHRPLHDLRISVIDRCNFRCTYCMPEEKYHEHYNFLAPEDWLTFDEIARISGLFVKLGVKKLRITGGEPLVRKNLPDLIRQLITINGIDDLAMTTNGLLLTRYARQLKDSGLRRLTVSLDTLDENIFRRMNGHKGTLAEVLEGIEEARQVGFRSIKINTVIQRGVNDATLLDLVRFCKEREYILRFIEIMDVGNRNQWKPEFVVPSKEILAQIAKTFPLEALGANDPGEVAERYRFKDGAGEIGFISSITQPFCGTCNRARISTDGKFYLCLFSGVGFDLREPLREGASDEEILKLIENIWSKRQDRYSEERSTLLSLHAKPQKIEMYQIGG